MSERKLGELPPLPVPPRKARRSSGTFTLESDTPTRTRETAGLGALVSVFEELTPAQRDRLTELGHLMARLSDEQIEELVDLAIEMNGLA